ncbi:hypothetical protein AVEN_201458-1, partial [Araneus ventricosus]
MSLKTRVRDPTIPFFKYQKTGTSFFSPPVRNAWRHKDCTIPHTNTVPKLAIPPSSEDGLTLRGVMGNYIMLSLRC